MGYGGIWWELVASGGSWYSLKQVSIGLCMAKGHSRCRVPKAHPRFSLGKAMIMWIHLDVTHLKQPSQSVLEMTPSSFLYRNYYSLNKQALAFGCQKGHSGCRVPESHPRFLGKSYDDVDPHGCAQLETAQPWCG